MGKLLLLPLLLLVLSSSLSFLQALKCHQCLHVNANGVCESGESVCQTHGDQKCLLRKVYDANTLLYGQQSCSSICAPMTLFNTDRSVEFKCCEHTDFCNQL